MEKVSFGFTKNTVSFSEEEFNKKIEDEENKGGKFLDVGIHTVEITEAGFSQKSVFSEKDPTWLNITMTLTAGEKSTKNFLCVPTKRLEFNPEESKRPMWAFVKFRAFMAAIGETVLANPESLNEVLPKYFSDPSKSLVGKRLKITIGWTGPHIKFVGKDQFKIANKDGSDNELFPMVFSSKEDAIQDAALSGLTKLKSFPDIISVEACEDAPMVASKPKASPVSVKKAPAAKKTKTVVVEVEEDEEEGIPAVLADSDDWE